MASRDRKPVKTRRPRPQTPEKPDYSLPEERSETAELRDFSGDLKALKTLQKPDWKSSPHTAARSKIAAARAEFLAPMVLQPRPVAWRIGLVVEANDHTMERDFHALVPHSKVGCYVNRGRPAAETASEETEVSEALISRTVAEILTGETVDALCYGCGLASVSLGDDRVFAAMAAGKPETPMTTPAHAKRMALGALGCSRISLITPYPRPASQHIAAYYAGQGIEVVRHYCMNLGDEMQIACVTPASIVAMVTQLDHGSADALVFFSTTLQSAAIVTLLEEYLGIPVVSSNQASIWMTLRLAGVADTKPTGGLLMDLPLLV